MARGRKHFASALVLAVLVVGGCQGGLAIGQRAPLPSAPPGEIEREESGEIVTVYDTMLDLRTGRASGGRVAPYVPIGPVAVAIPVTIGGESRRDVPGEELTVRLMDGRLIMIVQERASPAFGKGERVRVLHEKENPISGQARIRVERETR
jgi:hypothetical protein